ncbi:beta-N-acetylhexosaminidase [Paraglaciecola aestuariivivens]
MKITKATSIFNIALLTGFLMITACAVKPTHDPELKKLIAQKLMLDIRYFCENGPTGNACRTPVTQLPKALSSMVANTGIGGVIMFAENLQDSEQILKLNYALQQAAQDAGHPPLFIAIDQEGGRVVRIPQNLGTSFSGNMAIGATYAKFGHHFASETGKVMATELMSLGFNLNFAPTVDVNVNPLNPVINVRSYGENPQVVAELGTAQMAAMQSQGMMATLKHFPGHGDTSVDSHTGLPRVDHSLEKILTTDLLPFNYAIEHDNPAFIMTAHIQYPQLDSTEFTNTKGESSILPATMSRKILTDLLREQMGFKGLIVTDALDMAGIAHYFDQTEAVIQTFAAGADIALMPLTIRSPKDIKLLDNLLNQVVAAVQSGRLDRQEIEQSAARISQTKTQYQLATGFALPLDKAIKKAGFTLGKKPHRILEQELANSAIVMLKNQAKTKIDQQVKHLHLSMPDTTKCMALTLALKTRLANTQISCSSLANQQTQTDNSDLAKAEVVIVADITPNQSLAELGGMDDIQHWRQRLPKKQQINQQLKLLKTAKAQGKTTVFISLRTPYNVGIFADYADIILASFSYNLNQQQYIDSHGRLVTQYQGPIFEALAEVITAKRQATGQLPVTVEI